MQILGHLALGFFSSRLFSKALKVDVNCIVVFAVSLLPDVDLIFRSIIEHRTLTHSLVFALTLFIPLLIWLRRRAVPYFAAFASHAIIGDYFTAYGVQLLWPLQTWFVAPPPLAISQGTQEIVEVILFTLMIMYIWRYKVKIF